MAATIPPLVDYVALVGLGRRIAPFIPGRNQAARWDVLTDVDDLLKERFQPDVLLRAPTKDNPKAAFNPAIAGFVFPMGIKISRAQFEQNLWLKKSSDPFRGDIIPLLSTGNEQHSFDQDFDLVWQEIIAKLPGEPWNNVEVNPIKE